MQAILRSTVAASAVLWASLGAHAADLPPSPPPPPRAPAAYIPVAPPVYNWGGVYVGLNGGWGIGTAKWTVSGLPSNTVNPDGGLFGGTLGFNYQMSQFVLGVEGDWDWSWVTDSTSGSLCITTGNCQTGNKWLSTLRGRAGFAMDRVLFYATAGGVFASVQTVANAVTNTATKDGWTAGGGIEYAFAQNWTAKVEYLYADLGTTTVNCLIACSTPPGTPRPVAVGFTESLIRAGINYKFNF